MSDSSQSIKSSSKLYLFSSHPKLSDAALFFLVSGYPICRAIFLKVSFTAKRHHSSVGSALDFYDKLKKKKQDNREIFHHEEESNNASLKGKWNTSHFTKRTIHYFGVKIIGKNIHHVKNNFSY